jgi:ABC-type transport system substrate-binding protein
VAYQANVDGAHASPLGNELFSVMGNGTDTFVWMQNGEPAALWCSDETDGETLRACEQVYESLLAFSVGGTDVEPSLAESYTVNADLTEYTFTLRQGVLFQNGATLDANDVVASFAAQWDAASPNHVGRTGTFEYFGAFFGTFLNAPAQ